MRKGKAICKQLGIKQEELAMLLNISKGQLAMYETGKRDLPSSAMQQLAPMLRFMHEESLKSGSEALLKLQAEQQKKVLKQLLKDNQYKQIVLKRKLEIAEKKYHSNIAALQLMRFLENEAMKKDIPTNGLVKAIQAKATAELEKKGWGVLTKYQIEREVLLAEKKILLKMLG